MNYNKSRRFCCQSCSISATLGELSWVSSVPPEKHQDITLVILNGFFPRYSLLYDPTIKMYKLFNVICIPSNRLTVKVKVKVNFAIEQATMVQRGRRGIALLFL